MEMGDWRIVTWTGSIAWQWVVYLKNIESFVSSDRSTLDYAVA
jgi:hypothetical protein